MSGRQTGAATAPTIALFPKFKSYTRSQRSGRQRGAAPLLPLPLSELVAVVQHHRSCLVTGVGRPDTRPGLNVLDIVDAHRRPGRVVLQDIRAVERVLAVGRVAGLPGGPQQVDHAVVQPEDGVVGGREEIAHVAARAGVPAGVDAVVRRVRAVGVEDAVHAVLEGHDVVLAEQALDRDLAVAVAHDGRVQVAPDAVRVVVQCVGREAGYAAEWREVAKVTGEIREWTGGDAAAARAGWRGVVAIGDVRVAGIVEAVRAQAKGASVEDRTVGKICGVLRPVHVGKIAGISTLLSHRGLEQEEELAMPGQEDTIDVDVEGGVDVVPGRVFSASSHTTSCVVTYHSLRTAMFEDEQPWFVVGATLSRQGEWLDRQAKALAVPKRFESIANAIDEIKIAFIFGHDRPVLGQREEVNLIAGRLAMCMTRPIRLRQLVWS
nr:hypothetical protein CFP56_20376 [Quercus suber]